MKIPQKIIAEIFSHLYDEAPLEACENLAGYGESVVRFYPMTNADQSPKHYSFDPQEQIFVLKKSLEHKLDLIAVYHSHPTTAARPSEEDIRLAYDPGISYVIISLMRKPFVLKSFKIAQGRVISENVEII